MDGNMATRVAEEGCPFAGAEPITLPINRSMFDPAPELSRLREQTPLTRMRYADGHVGWLVTSYELARQVLGDPRFSVHPFRPTVVDPELRMVWLVDAMSSDVRLSGVMDRYVNSGKAAYEAAADPEVVDLMRSSDPLPITAQLLTADAPRHTRLRQLLASHFTPRSVNKHRGLIEDIVARQLEAMEQVGPPLDLYETFCLSVPAQLICALLGASPTEAHRFEEPTTVLVDPKATTEQTRAADHAFDDFLRELIQRKHADPSDDLLSELVQGGQLSDEEILELGKFLFMAGHETTASMFGLSVMALLQDRTRWDALRADPTIAGAVVEEMLRYHTIIHQTALSRTALEDVEMAGQTIRAGEAVAVSLAAANRDPHKFADPDRLDMGRKDSAGHLAFAFGIHQCLGQHFARLELQVGLTALAIRFPGLRLAVPIDEVPMRDREANSYGPERLPVTW